jgi:anthranilate synthase component 1
MNPRFKLHSEHKKILADTLTPVSVYLKIRDQYPHSLLLESSDYDARANNFSYICCNPIATLCVTGGKIKYTYPDGDQFVKKLTPEDEVPLLIQEFAQQFESKKFPFKFITNGLFGFISHEAVAHFEQLSLDKNKDNLDLPEIYYAVYQNIIAISLFNHEAHLFSHSLNGENNLDQI